MEKKIFFLLIFGIIFAMSFSSALTLNDSAILSKFTLQSELPSCNQIIFLKNNVIGYTLPSEIPFTTDNFNLYFNKSFYANIDIKNKTISDLSCSENNKSNYNVYIENTQTIVKIVESNDKIKTVNKLMKSGEIQIKGVGFGKKLKIFFMKIGLNIFNWFN